MNFNVWAIAVLTILGCISATPVNDGEEFIKALIRNEILKEIPSGLLEELSQNNLPAKIKITIPKNQKRIQLNVGAVNPNQVVDELLKEVDDDIKASGLDPYPLADFSIFGMSIALTISNYDTLHRNGEASMTIYNTYSYEFYSDVQVYSLTGDFAFSFTFFGITYNAGVNAVVDTVDADVDFTATVNSQTNATCFYVKSLESSDIGRISIEVTGLGPLDPFANVIANIFLNIFSFVIPWLFDGLFLDIVNQIVASLYPADLC